LETALLLVASILTAIEFSRTDGAPNKTYVLNLLHRLIDGKVVRCPLLDKPQALSLHCEP
jgi:hypothetical protein